MIVPRKPAKRSLRSIRKGKEKDDTQIETRSHYNSGFDVFEQENEPVEEAGNVASTTIRLRPFDRRTVPGDPAREVHGYPN